MKNKKTKKEIILEDYRKALANQVVNIDRLKAQIEEMEYVKNELVTYIKQLEERIK